MKHIEIRDLWLQVEGLKGLVEVMKVRGTENPADLMKKYLSITDIKERLAYLNLRLSEAGQKDNF